MAKDLETLRAQNQEIARIGDIILRQGYSLINDTVMLGVFQRFSCITQGLSPYLISGEARFFSGVQVWKTKGLHVAYNSEYFRVLNQEEYENRQNAGIENHVVEIYTTFISKTTSGQAGSEEETSKAYLVSTGKEKFSQLKG